MFIFKQWLFKHKADTDEDPCAIRDCPEMVHWFAGPFCGKHDKAIREMLRGKLEDAS